MTSLSENPLHHPYAELNVLKENKYKKVSLNEDSQGQLFIAKSYRGHTEEHSVANSEYAFDVLSFFYEYFNDVAIIPEPLHHDPNMQTVYLEYLPDLQTASLLTIDTLDLANPFFERCYEIASLESFRCISKSLAYNDAIKHWIESGKKMSLGLKGDLWQNLCHLKKKLIFADIDSAALEPLGLSEIVMRAEIIASFKVSNFFAKVTPKTVPICFHQLSKGDAQELCNIALRLISSRMTHLPAIVRKLKLRKVRKAMTSDLEKHYG